jgi:hypothetical protein
MFLVKAAPRRTLRAVLEVSLSFFALATDGISHVAHVTDSASHADNENCIVSIRLSVSSLLRADQKCASKKHYWFNVVNLSAFDLPDFLFSFLLLSCKSRLVFRSRHLYVCENIILLSTSAHRFPSIS